MFFDLPWKLIACDFGFQVEKNMPASAAAVGCGVSLATFWEFFVSHVGVYLESRRRYKKQPRCRNDVKASWKRPGGVWDASCECLEAPWRHPGGLWERPGRVLLFIGDVFYSRYMVQGLQALCDLTFS